MGRDRVATPSAIAASYWTALALGVAALALHVRWYVVDRSAGGEVVSGFGAALATLGLTQNAGAKLVGVNPRTGKRWALGDADIPPPAARLLRYLIQVGADPAKVRAILDALDGESDVSSHDDAPS